MKFINKYAHIFFLFITSVVVAVVVAKVNNNSDMEQTEQVDLTFSKSDNLRPSAKVVKEEMSVKETEGETVLTQDSEVQVVEFNEANTKKSLDVASAVSLFLESVEKNRDSFSIEELKDVEKLAVNMQYEIEAIENEN